MLYSMACEARIAVIVVSMRYISVSCHKNVSVVDNIKMHIQMNCKLQFVRGIRKCVFILVIKNLKIRLITVKFG